MLDKIKKELYFNKVQLLLLKGLQDGSIEPFDDELYEKMSHTYVSGLPVSMQIKYLNPINIVNTTEKIGKCFDRSLFMFFCFENSILVRGNQKELEYKYGKDKAGHGWIEMDGYCYDPTLLFKFKKETYYKIYKPYKISKITTEEYKKCSESNKKFYEDIKNTTLSDFQPNGSKRINLDTIIPPVKGIAEMEAEMKNNQDFIRELNEYLELIQYDEKEICEERDNALKKIMFKKNI